MRVDPGERQSKGIEVIKGNWHEHYPGAREKLPKDLPTPKEKKVIISTYVDEDHAHDNPTRRSVTGTNVFLNNTPVKWYSKRQNTVESSTCGAELVALHSYRICD